MSVKSDQWNSARLQSRNHRQLRKRAMAILTAVSAVSAAHSANAATYYWDPNGTATLGTFSANWDSSTAVWATQSTGTTSMVNYVSGSDAYFAAPASANALAENINFDASVLANSLQLFYGTETFTASTGGVLNIGAGGVLESGAASFFGNPTFASSLPIVLTASQVWDVGQGGGTNHPLNSNGTISGSAAAGNSTLFVIAPFGSTLPGASGMTQNGTLTDGIGGGALTVFKAGTGILNIVGTGNYTGGTNVESGALNITTTGNLGAGSVALEGGELVIGSAANFTAANYTTANGFLVGPRAGIAISNTGFTTLVPGTSGVSATGGGTAPVTLAIDPNSSGFFAFGGVNQLSISTALNLAALGQRRDVLWFHRW